MLFFTSLYTRWVDIRCMFVRHLFFMGHFLHEPLSYFSVATHKSPPPERGMNNYRLNRTTYGLLYNIFLTQCIYPQDLYKSQYCLVYLKNIKIVTNWLSHTSLLLIGFLIHLQEQKFKKQIPIIKYAEAFWRFEAYTFKKIILYYELKIEIPQLEFRFVLVSTY